METPGARSHQILGGLQEVRKKQVATRDCGATTAGFVNASVVAPAEQLEHAIAVRSSQQTFVTDDDYGAAADIGGPAVSVARTDRDKYEAGPFR
jgi:hypothetical protein